MYNTLCNTQTTQTPVIYSLSQTVIPQGEYTSIGVNGINFVYGAGNTNAYITSLADGTRLAIPCAFYSSLNCAFVVPVALPTGQYSVEIGIKYRIYGSTVVSQAFSNVLIFQVV